MSNANLESVISDSPVEHVSGYYYVLVTSNLATGTLFASLSDGIEQTYVVRTDVPSDNLNSCGRGPYRLLRLRVARPFEAPGFLAAACTAVASAGCNVLVYSTFSFDYLLVAGGDLPVAFAALLHRGFGGKESDARGAS